LVCCCVLQKLQSQIENSWLLYLKFIKIRVGTFLVTRSFRIYSEATIVEWEEWAVDDSCSDTEEQNDIPNDPWYTILVTCWLTITDKWQKIFVRFRFCFCTYLQFVTTLYFVRMFIRLWITVLCWHQLCCLLLCLLCSARHRQWSYSSYYNVVNTQWGPSILSNFICRFARKISNFLL